MENNAIKGVSLVKPRFTLINMDSMILMLDFVCLFIFCIR